MAKRAPRAQYFTFEIYPESAPKNYVEILKDYHISMYLSKHDKDVDVETGEAKKEHVHVLVMFESLKGLDALDDVVAAVNGVKPPLHKFIVRSPKAYARYLSHMDEDPNEKYPYYLDSDHVVSSISGAADYYEFCRRDDETRREEMNNTKDIQDYCEKKHIHNVATFLRLCRATDHDEWIEMVKRNAYFWGMWFNSLSREERKQYETVEKILHKEEENNESDD